MNKIILIMCLLLPVARNVAIASVFNIGAFHLDKRDEGCVFWICGGFLDENLEGHHNECQHHNAEDGH